MTHRRPGRNITRPAAHEGTGPKLMGVDHWTTTTNSYTLSTVLAVCPAGTTRVACKFFRRNLREHDDSED
jgi:hypothetical protein